MIWEEIAVDRMLRKSELRAGLASILGVAPQDVTVLKDITDPSGPSLGAVACETRLVEGEFMLRLTVYYRGDGTPPNNTLRAVGELCAIWNCRAIIPDETLAPSSSWLLERAGNYRRVTVDIDALDNASPFELDD